MKPITLEWLKAAKDDLLVIQEIVDREYLTHLTAFHAQQAIEKTFKAVLEEYSSYVPRMHNLEKLAELVSRHLPLDLKNDTQLIEELDKLYTDARYPGDLGLLPDGKPSLESAKTHFALACSIYDYVQSLTRRDYDQCQHENNDQCPG